MDLNDLIPTSDTVVIELTFKGEVLKNDDETPMTVEAYLPHSKQYRLAKHTQADKLIEGKRTSITSAEAEELGLERLALITKDWNITLGGKKPKATTAKCKEVYDKFEWIAELVLDKVENSEAFI
jgi:hypothetical protein